MPLADLQELDIQPARRTDEIDPLWTLSQLRGPSVLPDPSVEFIFQIGMFAKHGLEDSEVDFGNGCSDAMLQAFVRAVLVHQCDQISKFRSGSYGGRCNKSGEFSIHYPSAQTV